MKNKNIIFLCFCIVVLILLKPADCMAQEPSENEDIEVFILLDTSDSMSKDINGEKTASEKNSKIYLLKEWAKNLCAFLVNTNIKVSIYTFGDVNGEKEKIAKQYININNAAENINMLNRITVENLNDTDHNGALKKAKQELGQDAKYKYIIMLSDGATYYDIVDEKERNDKISDGIQNFEQECANFVLEQNTGIFLVGFGQDVSMFKEVEKEYIKSLENTENQPKGFVSYIEYSKEPSQITEKIFETCNMKLSLQVKDADENGDLRDKIEFQTETDQYRTIVNIVRKSNMDHVDQTQIKLSGNREGQEEELKPEEFDMLCIGNSAYIYLEPSRAGNYTISVPEDVWCYAVYNQENGRIKEVRLTLDKLKPEKEEENIRQYILKEEPEELTANIEIVWEYTGNNKSPNKVILANTSQEEKTEEDWERGMANGVPVSSSIWSMKLKKPKDNNENIYQACVTIDGQNIYSNSIQIEREWRFTIKKELKKGEECDLVETVSEKFTDYIGEPLHFEVPGEDEKKDDGENEKYTIWEEKNITFHEQGKYTVNVKYHTDVIGEVEFTVKEQNEDMNIRFIVIAAAIVVGGIIAVVRKGRK